MLVTTQAATASGARRNLKIGDLIMRFVRELVGRMFGSSVAACILLSGGVGTADADIGQSGYTHCYMNVNETASPSQAHQYSDFIHSLRNAAGHDFRTDLETQGAESGIILVTLRAAGGPQLSLWINPHTLYVLGFTNMFGQTFIFNDNSVLLSNRIAAAPGAEQIAGGGTFGETYYDLRMGGNYNSLEQRGVGRDRLQINYNSFWNAIYNLAYADPDNLNGDTARALMLMIQLTSEAARFNDVFGVGLDVMGNGNAYNGLPVFQQYLENNWGQISNYGYRVTNDPTASLTLNGINPDQGDSPFPSPGNHSYTLTGFWDVFRFLGIMLNSNMIYSRSVGGISEDWSVAQL
jgi:hypothetical protein